MSEQVFTFAQRAEWMRFNEMSQPYYLPMSVFGKWFLRAAVAVGFIAWIVMAFR